MAKPEALGATVIRPRFAGMVAAPHQMVAMVFGLGLSRFWPGTLGTLAGFGLFSALQPVPPLYRVLIYVALVVLGSWASQRTGDDLKAHDHNSIVIDETIGMSLVLEFVAPGALIWIAAFLLFRLFDVLKPWPVYLADRRPEGGFYVILDDVLAAIYAGLAARYIVMPLLS